MVDTLFTPGSSCTCSGSFVSVMWKFHARFARTKYAEVLACFWDGQKHGKRLTHVNLHAWDQLRFIDLAFCGKEVMRIAFTVFGV